MNLFVCLFVDVMQSYYDELWLKVISFVGPSLAHIYTFNFPPPFHCTQT
jgi:hypothetical protein